MAFTSACSYVVAGGDLAGSNWHTVEHLVAGIGGGITALVIAVLVGVRLRGRSSLHRRLGTTSA